MENFLVVLILQLLVEFNRGKVCTLVVYIYKFSRLYCATLTLIRLFVFSVEQPKPGYISVEVLTDTLEGNHLVKIKFRLESIS